MSSINIEDIRALHRYFIWANRMRTHFEDVIGRPDYESDKKNEIESFLYMSYWYGGLYVVVEGWLELGLVDQQIDALLQSDNVALLKRYRNGVFHFQSDYWDDRFVAFMRDGQSCVIWVRRLNEEFGRYFLDNISTLKDTDPS